MGEEQTWKEGVDAKLKEMGDKYASELKDLKQQTNQALQQLANAESANSELQEAYLVQRVDIRKAEKAKMLKNFKNTASKRTVGFIMDLLNEVEDIHEAVENILPRGSDPFNDSIAAEGSEPLVTAENLEQADIAMKTSLLSIGEMKKRMKEEILAHECAEQAAGGWSAVAYLENKDVKKIAGETIEEKEENLLLIKKAEEDYKKHNKAVKSAKVPSAAKDSFKMKAKYNQHYGKASFNTFSPRGGRGRGVAFAGTHRGGVRGGRGGRGGGEAWH